MAKYRIVKFKLRDGSVYYVVQKQFRHHWLFRTWLSERYQGSWSTNISPDFDGYRTLEEAQNRVKSHIGSEKAMKARDVVSKEIIKV